MKTRKTVMLVMSIGLSLFGFWLMWSINWKIAFGVYLMIWGNNLLVRVENMISKDCDPLK